MHSSSTCRRVVFVGGVHGAGKSTLARSLATRFSLRFFSAGEVLRDEGVHPDLRVKKVRDVGGNQDALVAALDRLDLGTTPVILDGHFCLLNSEGKVEPIPDSTFQAIGIMGIVLVEADVSAVQARLSARDGMSLSAEEIGALLLHERTRAEFVSNLLKVPMFRTNSSGLQEVGVWASPILSLASS